MNNRSRSRDAPISRKYYQVLLRRFTVLRADSADWAGFALAVERVVKVPKTRFTRSGARDARVIVTRTVGAVGGARDVVAGAQ